MPDIVVLVAHPQQQHARLNRVLIAFGWANAPGDAGPAAESAPATAPATAP